MFIRTPHQQLGNFLNGGVRLAARKRADIVCSISALSAAPAAFIAAARAKAKGLVIAIAWLGTELPQKIYPRGRPQQPQGGGGGGAQQGRQ
jgi:hypothetical protein